MSDIFQSNNYKDYLNSWLNKQTRQGHGLRKVMASAIGTQTGFITQVLTGDLNFSPEQALSVAAWMGLSADERDFFLLLIQHHRAGTIAYRNYIESELEKRRELRKDLSKRIRAQKFPAAVDQVEYFSSWIYACIHVMITCEAYRFSRSKIAEALSIPIVRVNECIEFMIRIGLIEQAEDGGLKAGAARLHLDTSSPYLPKHHANWNLFSLQKLLTDCKRDLHFSSVISLSAADLPKVREIYTKAIEEANAVIRDSEGENVCSLTLNFIKIC